jgi:transposase
MNKIQKQNGKLMAKRGLEMYKIKQIIQLLFEGKSNREIASILCLSRKAVTKYDLLFESTGLSYESVKDMTEEDLSLMMATQEKPNERRLEILQSQFTRIEHELKAVGVTKQLLWSEYKVRHPDGYNYTQFCFHYKRWHKSSEVTMHFEHKAGDKMFVDFAGKKLKYIDRISGEVIETEVFVAILGASQLTYVEAVASQKKEVFVKVVENALHFFGGVPAAIVPDNLKSAVTQADKYEAELNRTFADFGLHYGTTILPTRSLKPRDKALVENAVKNIYTRIYAPLRDRVFFSLEELNLAIKEKLEKHNKTNFQNRDYSRSQLFAQIDEPALKPLPMLRYEIKNYGVATVWKNSYVWLNCDKHYYSVPFRYIGKKVKIEYTLSWVAIYCDNQRIAFHSRIPGDYGYTTIAEHLPSSHNFVNEWRPEKFIGWAQSVGRYAEKVITKILDSKAHPEQAYKSCVGILSYGKKIGYERLNLACRRADEYGSYSYRTIKNIIVGNYDKLSRDEQNQYQIPLHENIRGSEYYGAN